MQTRGLVTGAAIGVALVCAGGWFHAHQALRAATQSYVSDTLDPIEEMLEENARITGELGTAYSEPGVEFAAAYLIKIRRDGVGKHSDMKQRIDRVVNNNTSILALLAKYSVHARTAAFRASAERFREYAIALRDRWQSVPEIFMAGGNLPTAIPAPPPGFKNALDAEASAASEGR